MDTSLTLTTDMALVLGLLVFTVVMLILEWVRGDLVALLVIVVIGVTRLMALTAPACSARPRISFSGLPAESRRVSRT